jgi:magnesium transporter
MPVLKPRTPKAGLPPGSLVHIGSPGGAPPAVTRIAYSDSAFEEVRLPSPADAKPPAPAGRGVTWINVDGVHDVSVVEQIGNAFGLHPLVQEDILNTDQRPKAEDYAGCLYVVVRMIRLEDANPRFVTEQVSLLLGPDWVVSFQEDKAGDVFEPVRERLRTAKGRLRKEGADTLLHALLDAVVDHYFVVLDKLGERVEALEQEIVARPAPRTLHALHAMKREMIFLRRSVWPLREVLHALQRGESPLVRRDTAAFFRDVYDHTVQVMEAVETFRDILSGLLDIYLSSMSHRLNEVMKVLTLIATIFMPLTFIAGVYGMNFRHMPELAQPWGYPLALGIMAATAAGMVVWFKRKRWL